MEFETKKTDPATGISEIDRLTASTKQVTLTPIHTDVNADDMSDEYVVNQHILESPMANLETDTEVTAAYCPPEPVKATSHTSLIVIVCGVVLALLAGGVAAYVSLRR